MAQYPITHSCGHDRVVQIYGTNSHGERERKAEWLATQPCPDCAKAARMVDHELQDMVATDRAAGAGLPPLEGTPKQVRWAQSIRMEMFDELRASFAGSRYAGREDEIMAVYMRAASVVTSAAEWIDARSSPRTLIRDHLTDRDRAAIAAIEQQVRGG